jgi:hypothetical protein
MSVTLTITDNADGTGGVATVAGSNVAATNTLYKAAWSGQTGALTWTSVGSRTGDGTISVSSGTGFFVFRLDSLYSGTTTVVANYRPLTDTATQSILQRVLSAAKTRIDALALSGLTAVDVRWLPRAKPGDTWPLIAVCPVHAETFPGVMTQTDDIGVPFLVCIMDAQNQNPTANLNRNSLWREKILSALRYQRLAGVPEAYIVQPEPAEIINPGLFDGQNLFFSALLFRATTRTLRG